MNDSTFPYVTHMNILHKSLELVDIPALVKECKDKWYNQTLCQVNDSVVRLGILQGEYHWHKHDIDDEFFLFLKAIYLLISIMKSRLSLNNIKAMLFLKELFTEQEHLRKLLL